MIKIAQISRENTLGFMKNKNPLSEIMSPHYESFCDFSESLIQYIPTTGIRM